MKHLAKPQVHRIHRDLMIALSVGFAGSLGLVSAVVLLLG